MFFSIAEAQKCVPVAPKTHVLTSFPKTHTFPRTVNTIHLFPHASIFKTSSKTLHKSVQINNELHHILIQQTHALNVIKGTVF